jgi:hypothetical protein
VQYCIQSWVFGKLTTADAVPPWILMFRRSAPWPKIFDHLNIFLKPILLMYSEVIRILLKGQNLIYRLYFKILKIFLALYFFLLMYPETTRFLYFEDFHIQIIDQIN